MPLKFLKKCRQYNVTSKSLFVISVHHLLDTSTTVDCTVSSESKGQECLDNVCNRLQIHQPEFFGLRYVVKDKEDELKWIDLDRSLSRQLEKYANGTKIFLRVRHYVTTGVRHLTDEVTRYSYFLQLKSDIYEGKIACDIRTSILLALYCRQAEYDSYQGDKQQLSTEYLKRSLVFPKNLQGLCNDDSLLDSLIADVLQQNPGIQHLTQLQAEEMYIQCCQQLEGYGEERFQAKDTLGNDLLLGLAINGIVVNAENGRQYFPWKDFHTVTIDKRTIKIEQNKNEVSIVGSFIFHEAETARYFWKLCVTQHKFFKRHIDEDNASVSGSMNSANGVLSPMNATDASTGSLAAYAYEFSDSREDLLMEQQQQQQQLQQQQQQQHQRAIYNAEYQTTTQSLQQQHLNPQQISQSATALMSSNISLAVSHQSTGNSANGAVMHGHLGGNGGGIGGSAMSQTWLNKDFNNEYMSSQSHISNSMLDTRIQSSSCLDLSNNNLHSSINLTHNNNNNLMLDERERLKAMLPTYRPAPDYETAVQLKYRASASELHNLNNIPYQSAALAAQTDPRMLQSSHYYAGSQPDVHNAGVYGATDNMLLSQMAPHRYPDVAQPAAALHAHAHHLNANAAAAAAAVAAATNIGNSSNIYSNMDLAQRLQIIRSKPPPPYPVNRLSSSSTPDLAVASHRPLLGYRAYVSGSSPDLVSNRNMLNSQYPYGNGGVGGMSGVGIGGGAGVGTVGVASMVHQYPYFSHMGHSQPYLPHGTFENLNMIEEQPSIMSQLRQSAMSQAAAQQASQTYEQQSPTVPSAAAYISPAPNVISPPSTTSSGPAPAALQRNAMNGSIEPIYENVPLPHYTSSAAGGAIPQRQAEHRSSSTSNSSDAMRDRASSIQSAPGGIQPPVPAARTHVIRHNQTNTPNTFEPDEISMNIQKFGSHTHADRAASTEHFLEPTAPQRAMRAASAAPAINVISPPASSVSSATGQTPPPRNHHKVNLMKTNSIDVIQPATNITPSVTKINRSQLDDSSVLNHQFGAMNLCHESSSSTSFFNSSTNSNTLDGSTTLNTSDVSSTANTSKEVKRKKRWNILGRRSKTPDKQKSATLGREKTTKTQMTKGQVQDDLNLTHRWSTGVPKLQPISGTFSREKLSQILNDKLNDSQLFMEFERIPKRREYASYDCALMEENAMKNSDPNFLPYDDNRVRITPTMENRHGYVNASHISATVGTKQRFYIVAQSPQQELTTRIFWQCVWEADVYLVVQLSDDVNYVPPNSNRRLEFGQFQVYQEFSQTTDRCVTSKLRLYHMQSRRYRSVWHLNYTDWGEQNCPREVNHFLDFLEELNSVRMASINEVPPGHNTNPPVLIHCLEGGGRSGVTLTADLLLYTLDHNEDLDIPRVIGQLRHQRDSIIPSLAQYKFIYSLLITYLKRTRLI